MTMHAVVGVWAMDDSRRELQEHTLRTELLPRLRECPGFVSGFWMRDPDTGKAHTTIVLDSERAARAFKTVVEGNRQAAAQVGITNDTLAVVEVTAASVRLGVDGDCLDAHDLSKRGTRL